MHTVPTLVDNGQAIYDSHAIVTYLVSKYGKVNDPLYPTDLIIRAQIDQRLQFDTAYLFNAIRHAVVPIFYEGDYIIGEKAIPEAIKSFEFLETFLSNNKYVVGNHLTVADLSLIVTVTQLLSILSIDIDNYPRVKNWISGFDELSYFQEFNTEWLKNFVVLFNTVVAKNKAAAGKN